MSDLDPAGLEAAAKALQADRGVLIIHAGRYDSHRATVAVRAYLAAVLPPDEENPQRWFVGVSADRPMEIQFTEANGPGGWVQADEHDRAVARAFAAGRAAATPDPPNELTRWFVSVSAADPMRVSFREAHGPGPGFYEADEADALIAKLRSASPDERLREALREIVAAFPSPPGREMDDEEIEKWYADHGDWFQRLAALAAADREAPDEEGRICCRGMGADGGCNICAAEATR